MFSMNIHFEQEESKPSRLYPNYKMTAGSRQVTMRVSEGWWVAPCTREATETETCWSFPLSQSPLLPKLVWVPDMKINQSCILNRQICSAVLAGSLILYSKLKKAGEGRRHLFTSHPHCSSPKVGLLLPLPSCEPLLLPQSLFSFYDHVCQDSNDVTENSVESQLKP